MEYHVGSWSNVTYTRGPSSYLMTYSNIATYIRLTDACPCLKCSLEIWILNRYFRRYKDMTISGINSLHWTPGSITRSRRVPATFISRMLWIIHTAWKERVKLWTRKWNKSLSYSRYEMISIMEATSFSNYNSWIILYYS